MEELMDRKLYRKPTMVALSWVSAGVWLTTAIIDVSERGKPGALHVALMLAWAVTAVIWTRPYAVTNAHGITLATAPLRPRTLAWSQIVSFDEDERGIARIGLSDGAKLTVSIKEARVQDQECLRQSLQPQGMTASALASTEAL